MTTAARPTWAPQQGGTGKHDTNLSSISKQFSARDISAHTKLKTRQPGQGSRQDVADKDFRADLDRREEESRKRTREKDGTAGEIEESKESKKLQLNVAPNEDDADEPLEKDLDEDDEQSKEGSDEEKEDEEDDDDDTEELMKELQRIKRERLEEQSRKEAAAAAERERINIVANPLMRASQGDFSVKRRWDDDVVFKNCAKQEKRQEIEFINDTLRSGFHRKFMSKYIV